MLNSFCSSILLQLESSNFWGFWRYFQDDGTFVSKLPTFKTMFAFVVLTLFKLPDPGASIYVQSLLKFPTRGTQGRSKSPPPSGITLIAALQKPKKSAGLMGHLARMQNLLYIFIFYYFYLVSGLGLPLL